MYLIFIQAEICLLAPHLMREVFFQLINVDVRYACRAYLVMDFLKIINDLLDSLFRNLDPR